MSLGRIGIVVLALIAISSTATAQFKLNRDWLNPEGASTTRPSLSGSSGLSIASGGTGGISVSIGGVTEESLEWMAADCSIIFLAKVRDSTQSTATVIVQESIKGGLVPGISINLNIQSGRDDCYRDDMALFFVNENKLSVLFPFKPRPGRSAINLTRRPHVVCMDRSVLSKRPEIIETVRAASRFVVDPTKRPIMVVCSTAMGSLSLVLPPDERAEKLAHTWAAGNSLEDRVVALRVLRHFKSDQNIALAQRFLFDTRARTARGLGKWQMGFYPVRAEAHNVLADWNVPHPHLPDMGPVYIYQPLRFSGALLWWPGSAALLLGTLIILRRSGHRLLVSWTIAVFCMAAILCLSLLWKRSHGVVDEIMFSIKDGHHELALYQGGIQYQVVREWTLPPKVVYGSFDLRLGDDIWSSSALNPVVDRQLAGFMSGHGHLAGPAGVIHPYKLIRLPLWILIVPFGIVLLYQLHLLRRQLRRRRLGLCRSCGYDLRENSNGKCPECGVSVTYQSALELTA